MKKSVGHSSYLMLVLESICSKTIKKKFFVKEGTKHPSEDPYFAPEFL